MALRLAWMAGGVLVLAAFSWVAMVAPPLVSFSVAAAMGAAWCRWLETRPEFPKR